MTRESSDGPVYLRLATASQRYGLSVSTLRRWAKRGVIRASKPTPNVMLVSAASIEEHLAAQAVQPA